MKLTKSILRTTDNYIKSLEKGGITTVDQLLAHFPREYEDRTQVLDTFAMINVKEKNTILVKLLTIDTTRTANNKLLTKAVLEDKNWFLAEAVWFNRKYLSTQLKAYKATKVLITGKVKYNYGKVSFSSPEVETDLSKIEWSIVPIYPDLNYIPGRWLNNKIELLRKYIRDIPEELPADIVKKYNFISKAEAFDKIHFPKNTDDIERAKERLAYEELYNINYKAIKKKHDGYKKTAGKSIPIPMNPDTVKDILSHIPFTLTNGQKVALFQLLKDMEKPHSMTRLMEWDVGTGKTIVALVATIHAILETSKTGNRIQAAIMAPTEILTRQHFEWIQDLLFTYHISSSLLIWSTTAKQKREMKIDMKNGNIDIVVGTHALVQEDVFFHNLWLVIIDEQHRFGVRQRWVLEKWLWNQSGIMPHSLNMTATPIPRTLALTLYWDQDLSIISEYPKGRKEIHTKVAKNDEERRQIELFVENELKKWRQVFWISPLVEESEKIDLANAINTHESLSAIFSEYNVWLLHGKMKAKEKEAVMREFSENKIQMLSSTSVVEVWVDVPNATIMCIEWAERFGLSQLHQFRGRVGRWEHQSYCYLFPTSGQATDRLRAMERTNNWFELSEIDLELRGPGEVYGVRQSGLPDLKIADLKDLDLISQIREDIEDMFEEKSKK